MAWFSEAPNSHWFLWNLMLKYLSGSGPWPWGGLGLKHPLLRMTYYLRDLPALYAGFCGSHSQMPKSLHALYTGVEALTLQLWILLSLEGPKIYLLPCPSPVVDQAPSRWVFCSSIHLLVQLSYSAYSKTDWNLLIRSQARDQERQHEEKIWGICRKKQAKYKVRKWTGANMEKVWENREKIWSPKILCKSVNEKKEKQPRCTRLIFFLAS